MILSLEGYRKPESRMSTLRMTKNEKKGLKISVEKSKFTMATASGRYNVICSFSNKSLAL